MDNLDLEHISHPSEQDYARLKEYSEVKALLALAAAAEPGY